MSLHKEDYNTAALYFPITYKKVKAPLQSRYHTFTEIVQGNRHNFEEFPHLNSAASKPKQSSTPFFQSISSSQFK